MVDRVGSRVVTGIVGLLLVGCPKGGPSAELQSAYEVASLRAAQAEAAVQGLQDRVASLEALLREGGGAASDELAGTVATVRGQVEEVRFDVDRVSQDFSDYQLTQERRLLWAEQRVAALEQLLGVQPPPPPCVGPPEDCPPPSAVDPSQPAPPTQAPPPPGPGAVAGGPDDTRIALARERMDAGQQAAARAILEALLQQTPDHPRAAEIHYRIGETWFNEGRYRQAARAFREVTDRYASSPFAPWALLRSGESFEGMGHAEDARVFYQSVLQSYPSSEAAPEAKRRLKP